MRRQTLDPASPLGPCYDAIMLQVESLVLHSMILDQNDDRDPRSSIA